MKEATLRDFYGQSALIERLEGDFRSGQFVHAYLFVGPRGVGKRSVARLLARTALCTGADKPCGICGSCVRFLTDNHPDVKTLRPEKSLGVDEVRDLIASVQLRAFEGGAKIALIERADRMTAQAQNCLLKTLEEPPGGTIFFLMTDTPSALLPTIVSRCRTVHFHPLTQAEEEARLLELGIASERAALLSQLSEGSVGEALSIEADDSYLQLRSRVMQAVFDLRGPQDVLLMSARFKDDKGKCRTHFGHIGKAAARCDARSGGRYAPCRGVGGLRRVRGARGPFRDAKASFAGSARAQDARE